MNRSGKVLVGGMLLFVLCGAFAMQAITRESAALVAACPEGHMGVNRACVTASYIVPADVGAEDRRKGGLWSIAALAVLLLALLGVTPSGSPRSSKASNYVNKRTRDLLQPEHWRTVVEKVRAREVGFSVGNYGDFSTLNACGLSWRWSLDYPAPAVYVVDTPSANVGAAEAAAFKKAFAEAWPEMVPVRAPPPPPKPVNAWIAERETARAALNYEKE